MLVSFLLPIFIRSFTNLTQKETSNDTTNTSYIKYSAPGVYSFNLPTGRYKISCYGAQGGWSHNSGGYGNAGGKGALVSGYIDIEDNNLTFYAIVGGQGQSRDTGLAGGGYNGGGTGGWCKKYKKKWYKTHKTQRKNGPGGGGGASEIRFGTNEMINRVMVAGGGSGASLYHPGAPGGNLTGFTLNGPSTRTTQTSGNENGIGSSGSTSKYYPSSGAGAGYRGGLEGSPSNSNPAVGVSDSGSSYISGFPNCTIHPKLQFDTPEMVVGAKEGNGYIQIDRLYQCPSYCTSCSGPSQCKICDMPYRLYNGLCILECPDQTIDRYTYCENCDPTCDGCSKVSTNCTDCYEGYYFYKNQCLEKCPDNTYEYEGECFESCPSRTFPVNSKCEDCDYSCVDCVDSSTKCTSCPEGIYLFNFQCYESCPDRTYRDGNICTTECLKGQFLHDGYCYTKCPKGYYGKDSVCEECDSSCSECDGTSKTCTNCNDGSYLSDSKCIERCKENDLFYKNICVNECPNNTFLNGNQCVDVCPNGKFGNGTICSDCDSSCTTCENSSTICTNCPENLFLFANQCLSTCLNGTFRYQNQCITECPPGSQFYKDTCIIEIDYYTTVESVSKKPKGSKGGLIAGLTILSIFCAGEIAFLVYCIVFYDK